MTDFLPWTKRDPITNEELILLCLKNAPEGTDRNQVLKLIKEYEALTK